MCLQLPYYRNTEELPAPLPTSSEILASKDIIKGAEAWATTKVVGVGEHFIVKYSISNNQFEGENLLFLEQNNLRGFAPRLYAMWKEPDGTLFLTMERFRGDTLESLWPTLLEFDKTRILAKMRTILTQIRATPHQDFFGSINRSHMPFHLFYWPDYPAHISGPFPTERALIQGLISKSRLNARENRRDSYLADFFEEQLARNLVVDERTPIFTHADLQRKNILVEEVEGDHHEKDFRVSLVDWESAGWYPVYWEYFAAFTAFQWNDDWPSRVAEVVDGWPSEVAMMRMIYQDLWM